MPQKRGTAPCKARGGDSGVGTVRVARTSAEPGIKKVLSVWWLKSNDHSYLLISTLLSSAAFSLAVVCLLM